MTDENLNVVSGPAESVQTNLNHITNLVPDQEAPKVYAPDLARLSSALSVLDPDCDEHTWKFKRLAPLANTAKMFPACGDALYQLSVAWSRGDLQDKPSKAWTTPGGNGKSGKQVFNSVWARFFNGSYSGKPATLGTIYFEARAAGWIPPEEQFASSMKEPE